MNAEQIYKKMRQIAESYHAYSDQLADIAKWVESEFDYNSKKNWNKPTDKNNDVLKNASGYCRDCKHYTPDEQFPSIHTCENKDLKLNIIFAFEGGNIGVNPDFGCIQFEKK